MADSDTPATRAHQHMRSWAQSLVDGNLQRDPVEDTADEVWQSLRVFAVEYLSIAEQLDKWRSIADAFATAITLGANGASIEIAALTAALARYREAAG